METNYEELGNNLYGYLALVCNEHRVINKSKGELKLPTTLTMDQIVEDHIDNEIVIRNKVGILRTMKREINDFLHENYNVHFTEDTMGTKIHATVLLHPGHLGQYTQHFPIPKSYNSARDIAIEILEERKVKSPEYFEAVKAQRV